ncbi:MAG TPA: hypothetical protein EYP67_03515 [Methanosarcinales archaeon]|nr:hypothetical protein [Methanosarcinales archaeon]
MDCADDVFVNAIVGETEIVPSRDIFDTGIRDATDHWTGGSIYPVTCVDNTYADISGSDNLPELIVARIIGNSADQLTTPIETSLLDQFERTDAFVISGTGGGQSTFEANADEVAGIIDDEFTVDLMHGGDYASDATRLTQFTTRARDKDVLFYRDHGSVGCWSHTICTWNFPVNFGNSYPFAFGSACLTGHFEGSYCIGEAFLIVALVFILEQQRARAEVLTMTPERNSSINGSMAQCLWVRLSRIPRENLELLMITSVCGFWNTTCMAIQSTDHRHRIHQIPAQQTYYMRHRGSHSHCLWSPFLIMR